MPTLPTNYTSFVAPAKGGAWTDNYSGFTTTRLTDAFSDAPNCSQNTYHHSYATMSAINKNDDRMLIEDACSDPYVIDLQGNRIVWLVNLFGGNAVEKSEAKWGRKTGDEYVIYYLTPSAPQQLRRVDISSCTAATPCDGAHGTAPTDTLVHTFSEYTSLAYNREDDLSDDGDHVAMAGYNGTTTDIFLYSMVGGKGPTANFAGQFNFDNFKVTHDNRIAIVWNVPEGFGAGQGTELWGSGCTGIGCVPASNTFVRQLTPVARHGDTVYAPSTGKSYWVYEDSSGFTPCSPYGLAKSDIATGVRTCLASMPPASNGVWTVSGHVSCNSNGTCTYNSDDSDSGGDGTKFSNPDLPAGWASLWKNNYNTIVRYDVESGAQTVLGFHRSRGSDAGSACNTYWSAARPSQSISGSYVAFDSNMTHIGSPLTACITDYTDVYVINTQAAPAPPPSFGGLPNFDLVPGTDLIVFALSFALCMVRLVLR